MVSGTSRTLRSEPTADQIAAAMERPEFYGAYAGPVELRETHVSRVYLVGDRAYKLKKPLKLPFLDSSTADRRHQLCREELRLNRRLAPELYLDVRAIVEADDGLHLAGEDDPRPLDYVVEMRRYADRDTLAERVASGRLRLRDLTRLGRMLAEFHAEAPRVSVADASALELERRILENAHELVALVQHPSDFDRLLKVERFIHAFLRANSQVLAARVRAGRIREGHGDLRAEHVVLGRRIDIVDCIEFDRHLRESDVAEDLAFLVMDLTALGAERQSKQLVEAYRAAGGDAGDDQLIAFYACHRALIRAKVALLRAGQDAATSTFRGHDLAVARDLLAVAERFAWCARLPLVVVVCGVPAVGKTLLAEALANASGLEHLSSDVTRKRLAGVGPVDHAGACHYTAEANVRVYTELGRLAAAKSAACGGAIVDATFRHREDRQAFNRAFRRSTPAVFVECRAPRVVIAERAAKRDTMRHQISDATLDVAVREGLVWDSLDEVLPTAHLMVRTDLPVASQVNDVSALLDLRLTALHRMPHH
jgi:uncharacterized protein